MSEEKKNGDYEKPESHRMEGDELEDVSGGGSGGDGCRAGPSPGSWGPCVSGGSTGQGDCSTGSQPEKLDSCWSGPTAYQTCRTGGHPY